jgi:hypothetical protein
MTLVDHQTGKDIISPYVLIGRLDLTRYAVNTESFRNCQKWLILNDTMTEDTTSDSFRRLEETTPVPVFAVVGDYNKGNFGYIYGVNRTVSLMRDKLFELEIGLIPLGVLRRELPRVYEPVKKEMDKSMKEALEVGRFPF